MHSYPSSQGGKECKSSPGDEYSQSSKNGQIRGRKRTTGRRGGGRRIPTLSRSTPRGLASVYVTLRETGASVFINIPASWITDGDSRRQNAERVLSVLDPDWCGATGRRDGVVNGSAPEHLWSPFMVSSCCCWDGAHHSLL